MRVIPGCTAGAITAATTHSQRINSIGKTTVVNKNIVYKDTVLPLKELGENLKITSVSNVEEPWIETCLNKIFEANPGVVFNTVQYSKKDKKIYFYTDQNISTKAWDDRYLVNYKPLNNSMSILEEIKKILLTENTFDINSVSLYDVAQLVKKRGNDMKQIEEYYQNSLRQQSKNIHHKFDSLIIYGLSRDGELRLGVNFGERLILDYQDIVFAKKNNDLYLKSDPTKYGRGRDLFVKCSSTINKCYDELMKFKDYKSQASFGFRSLNSCFFISVDRNGVSIQNKKYYTESDFKLRLFEDCYFYGVNSNSVLEVLKDNEDNVFKNIFINILDCPEWMQEELYSLRINQQEEQQKRFEEQRIEDLKKQVQEMKKQKRLELKRKIFPFLKK